MVTASLDYTDVGRFSAQGQATVNASGRAVVELGPHGNKWEIDSVRVYITPPSGGQVLEAKCVIFDTVEAPGYQIDGTEAGSTGDTSDTKHYIEDGKRLVVVWSGADVGGTAIVTVRGWQSLPHRAFRAVR
jgi:hypothetical protein